MAKDSLIKIWSLIDCTCVREITNAKTKFGDRTLTSLFYDTRRELLAVAATSVGVIYQNKQTLYDERVGKMMTHNKPITGLLYTPEFDLVRFFCSITFDIF